MASWKDTRVGGEWFHGHNRGIRPQELATWDQSHLREGRTNFAIEVIRPAEAPRKDRELTTRTSTFPLRLAASMKAALEKISERDGTSMNQFLVIAAAEKIAAMETERFFAERGERADRKAFRRILNRKGGEPPRADDGID